MNKLEEVLRYHIEYLYKKLNAFRLIEDETKLKEMKKETRVFTELLDDLEKNIENISYLDIDSVLSKLYSSQKLDKVLEELRLVKIVLEAKNQKHFPIDLSEEQNIFLQDLLFRIHDQERQHLEQIPLISQEIEKKKEEKEAIEDKIINLSIILEKILDPDNLEFLTQEEFVDFYDCILNKEIPYEKRKEALISWKNYNDKRSLLDKKVIERIDMASIRECFREYGLLDSVEKYLQKYEKEILYHGDISNIRGILSYLQEEDLVHHKPNLLSSFTPLNLLTMCIYGTVSSVKERYEQLSENKDLLDIYFSTPSVWIRNISGRRKHTSGIKRETHPDRSSFTLMTMAHLISFEEMVQNEKLLQELGFSVSLKEGKGIAAIKMPTYRLHENIDILTKYDILNLDNTENFPVSTLSFSDLVTKCDWAIEVGWLNPLEKQFGNYIQNYPSKLQVKIDFFAVLYKLKNEMPADGYYRTVFSENGKLNKAFYQNGYLQVSQGKSFADFLGNTFVDFAHCSYLPNYSSFEQIIVQNFQLDYDLSILNDPLIKKLETYHHVNDHDFQYVFGNVVVSRFKVLRIYSILKKQENIDLEEALLFAITYNSLLSEQSLQVILSQLGMKKGEVTYGIS